MYVSDLLQVLVRSTAPAISPAELCRIQRNVSVGVSLFSTLTHFLHLKHVPSFLSHLFVLLLSFGCLSAFCVSGCGAERLQLEVVAGWRAGCQACRPVFRVPLYGEGPHILPLSFSTHSGGIPVNNNNLKKKHFLFLRQIELEKPQLDFLFCFWRNIILSVLFISNYSNKITSPAGSSQVDREQRLLCG